MSTDRHINIVDLAEAIQDRVSTYCTTFAAVTRRGLTDRKAIVETALVTDRLPAAIVLIGPMDYDVESWAPGQRLRTINPGILVITEYDADPDAGSHEIWALIDELDAAFMPRTARGENEGQPIALLGDQGGTNRGVWTAPAGWVPVDAGPDRAAGVFNLICWDPVAAR